MVAKPAIFLDRDGVLILDHGYVYKPSDTELFPDVGGGLWELKRLGYLLVVITNQSGVARGYFSRHDVDICHDHITQLLKPSAVAIDRFLVCPHHPNGVVKEFSISCQCRKPGPGLINQACQSHEIDLNGSFVIGDKVSDIDCGQKLGIRSIQIDRGNYPVHNNPDALVNSFAAAVSFIKSQ